MKTDLFDYNLPEELIAFFPPKRRDGGRLLVLNKENETLLHQQIDDLPAVLPKNALLIGNNTKVFPARLKAKKPTGGAVEVLLVRPVETSDPPAGADAPNSCTWLALTKANKTVKPDDRLIFSDEIEGTVLKKGNQGETEIAVNVSHGVFLEYVEACGEIPLPPYIKRDIDSADSHRYQTTFAKHQGSVAAPTAGLHFTDELLAKIKANGVEVAFVTLHVGPGTFRPISSDNLNEHQMDSEFYQIPKQTAQAIAKAKKEGRPVIAIGTTVVRTLEGAAAVDGAPAFEGAPAVDSQAERCEGFTDIFIAPPYDFKVVDGLITNFHLPKSTLICLVSALAGRDKIMAAYQEAVAQKYRFYSYGDAMLILPRQV